LPEVPLINPTARKITPRVAPSLSDPSSPVPIVTARSFHWRFADCRISRNAGE
jgi:hypothetical protein